MSSKPKIEIYGTEYCGYCTAARMLLKKKGLDYEDILISKDEGALAAMRERTGRQSVPQIFINDQAIGGFDELYALEQSGVDQLDLRTVRPFRSIIEERRVGNGRVLHPFVACFPGSRRDHGGADRRRNRARSVLRVRGFPGRSLAEAGRTPLRCGSTEPRNDTFDVAQADLRCGYQRTCGSSRSIQPLSGGLGTRPRIRDRQRR